ncbi:MFS family permease [Bradyrhizobium sp. LB7.2]
MPRRVRDTLHDVQPLPGLRLLRLRQSDRAAAGFELRRQVFERRWIIAGAWAAIIIFGMAFARLTEPSLLIICGVLLTACNTTMSYAYHAYQTEVFPTQVRARASGLVYSMSRLSATFSGFIVAYMLKEAGVTGVFRLITAAMLIVVVAMTLFGPNVRGKPLDVV